MSAPPVVAGAHCGAHPAVAAVEICTRCGTFLCGDCVEYAADETPCCGSCLPLMQQGPASLRARLGPLLALAGVLTWLAGFPVRGRAGLALWVLSLPLGGAGLTVSARELLRVRAGRSSGRGRPLAWAGLLLGALYAVLLSLLVLAFAVFTYRQRDTGG